MKTLWCAAWLALCTVAVASAADDPIAFLKNHDAEVQAVLAGGTGRLAASGRAGRDQEAHQRGL